MPERRIIRKRGVRAGVTFSEVLVSALILSVAMVPIVQAMGRVHFFSARLEKVSRSQVLAQNQLEELRARAVSDFSGTWSVSNQALGGGYLGTISAEPDALLRTVSVSVGYDENGNGVLEGDEVLAVLRSRIARLQ